MTARYVWACHVPEFVAGDAAALTTLLHHGAQAQGYPTPDDAGVTVRRLRSFIDGGGFVYFGEIDVPGPQSPRHIQTLCEPNGTRRECICPCFTCLSFTCLKDH